MRERGSTGGVVQCGRDLLVPGKQQEKKKILTLQSIEALSCLRTQRDRALSSANNLLQYRQMAAHGLATLCTALSVYSASPWVCPSLLLRSATQAQPSTHATQPCWKSITTVLVAAMPHRLGSVLLPKHAHIRNLRVVLRHLVPRPTRKSIFAEAKPHVLYEKHHEKSHMSTTFCHARLPSVCRERVSGRVSHSTPETCSVTPFVHLTLACPAGSC